MFWNKKNTMKGFRELMSRYNRAKRELFEKAKSIDTIDKEWAKDKEYFEKSNHGAALREVMQEKYRDTRASLMKSFIEVGDEQVKSRKALSKFIKSNTWAFPLLSFANVLGETEYQELLCTVVKAHENEQIGDDVLCDVANYRRLDLGIVKAYVKDNRTQYADVILINDDNEILFCVRNKEDDFEPGKYCLPGGHVEQGESAKVAAARELLEETGIEVALKDLEQCGEYYDDKSHITYFCAHVNDNPLVLEEREQQQWERVKWDEVGEKPLLMNLKQNLETLIDIPKHVLRPDGAEMSKFLFLEGSIFESLDDLYFIKGLESMYGDIAKGKMEWSSVRDAIIESGKSSVLRDCIIVKADGSWVVSPKLIPDGICKAHKNKHGDLVQKPILVTRNGRTFMQKVWVKPNLEGSNGGGDIISKILPYIEEFPEEYGEIEITFCESEATDSINLIYESLETDKWVRVAFPRHKDNVKDLGGALNGFTATNDEILEKLGLRELVFVPNKCTFIKTREVNENRLQNYEEADLTLQEMYALGVGADLSKYKGKLAKDSSYVIVGDTVQEVDETIFDKETLERKKVGEYVYVDTDVVVRRNNGKQLSLFDNDSDVQENDASSVEPIVDSFLKKKGLQRKDIESNIKFNWIKEKVEYVTKDGVKKKILQHRGRDVKNFEELVQWAQSSIGKSLLPVLRVKGKDYVFYQNDIVDYDTLAHGGLLDYTMFRSPERKPGMSRYEYDFNKREWYDFDEDNKPVSRETRPGPTNAIPFEVKVKDFSLKEDEVKKSIVIESLTELSEEDDLVKGYKYLRREPDGKGGWRYYYEEKKERKKRFGDDVWDINRERDFGKVYTEFKGKPREAFDKIISERDGHAVDVFNVKLPVIEFDAHGNASVKRGNDGKPLMTDTGIDVVWGRADKQRHTGFGLAHIVDKHLEYQDDFNSVEELEDKLINVMESAKDGRNSRLQQTARGDYRIILQDREKNRIMISLKFKKDKETGEIMVRHFVLTSYDNGVSGDAKVRDANDYREMQEYFENWKPKSSDSKSL